jgi:hypothetical protein
LSALIQEGKGSSDLIVVGLKSGERHEEHLNADQQILDEEEGTSMQYMSLLE